MTRKQSHHEAIRARLERALGDLYHNATPRHPRDLYGRAEDYYQGWFDDAARFEIEYLQGGGAYGTDYRRILEAPCNAGRYQSTKARAYYVRKGMRAMREERAHCGTRPDGTPNNAQWERITEWGDLYQWGRGGRTLAPKGLITQHGGSNFSIAEGIAQQGSITSALDLLAVLESFNRYVRDWCRAIPDAWKEHCEFEDAEILAEKRRAFAARMKEARARRYWEARDVVTR